MNALATNVVTKEKAVSEIDGAFSSCKLIHIQALRIVYSIITPPITFKQLYKKIKAFTSERTLRDKVADLRAWGLIEAIDSGVLLIFPKENVKDRVIQLLNNVSAGGAL